VLQCVAVCYSVLQCVAVCCSVLQYVAVCCSAVQLDLGRCKGQNRIDCSASSSCNRAQSTALCSGGNVCSVPISYQGGKARMRSQCVAVCCSVLQL